MWLYLAAGPTGKKRKLMRSVRMESESHGIIFLIRRERDTRKHIEEKQGGHREKVTISYTRERSLTETNPDSFLSWTSSLQNCQKIYLCDLSPPFCGILLWRPEQTNTPSLIPPTSALDQVLCHFLRGLFSINYPLSLMFLHPSPSTNFSPSALSMFKFLPSPK